MQQTGKGFNEGNQVKKKTRGNPRVFFFEHLSTDSYLDLSL